MQSRSKQFLPLRGGSQRRRGVLPGPRSFRIAVCFAKLGKPVAMPIHSGPARAERTVCRVAASRRHFFAIRFRQPLSGGETSRDLLSPKAGLFFTPWERGLVRASYVKSPGGLFFDNSVRLEPTQVAGFNQAFRSLIPESVAGLVPGTEFEVAGVGFDQALPSGTWFGLEAEWLTSDGDRTVGVLTNSYFLPIPDPPGSTREALAFRERSLAAYAGQLLGESFSAGARYRVSEAKLRERFPQIPATALGLAELESDHQATLQQLSLSGNSHHRSGVFAQWESAWYHQSNAGDPTVAASEDFWQHNLVAGYRFPRRSAEIRLGLLNIFDTDYRLNPLNIDAELPRGRTFTASLRLSF